MGMRPEGSDRGGLRRSRYTILTLTLPLGFLETLLLLLFVLALVDDAGRRLRVALAIYDSDP